MFTYESAYNGHYVFSYNVRCMYVCMHVLYLCWQSTSIVAYDFVTNFVVSFRPCHFEGAEVIVKRVIQFVFVESKWNWNQNKYYWNGCSYKEKRYPNCVDVIKLRINFSCYLQLNLA